MTIAVDQPSQSKRIVAWLALATAGFALAVAGYLFGAADAPAVASAGTEVTVEMDSWARVGYEPQTPTRRVNHAYADSREATPPTSAASTNPAQEN